MRIFLCFLCCCLISVQAALICYDCEPSSGGQCLDPLNNNDKMTQCTETKSLPRALTLQPFNCFSIHYVPNNNNRSLSGVYRGCVANSDQNPCDYLKQLVPNGLINWCQTCSENRCNTAQPPRNLVK